LLGNMHHDNPNHAVQLGTRNAWGGSQPLLLSHADRRQHLYVIGKTGSGKTTLLRNLILQDIEAGEGVGLIDPHGDLAQDLLNHIPQASGECALLKGTRCFFRSLTI
jgi:type IV secretory pathway VirB4 component